MCKKCSCGNMPSSKIEQLLKIKEALEALTALGYSDQTKDINVPSELFLVNAQIHALKS